VPPEFLKEMEGFGLNVDDFQPDPEKKNRLKDAEEEQIIRVNNYDDENFKRE